MSSSYLLDPFVITLLVKAGKSYLDVACGRGKWGYLITTSHKPPSFIVGGDLDENCVKWVKEHKIYDEAIVFDARFLPFRDSCFDIVLVMEVIEHMGKRDGFKVLAEAERVIVSTPLLGARYWYSEEHHPSRWTVNDLRKKGYIVRGVGFSFFGRFTTQSLAFALAPLAFYIPQISYILLAWKDLRKI
ncbi:hypothetical protein DRJ19_06070 [Candidatus Woesearchaeota archaeon]|nr:MAG: hypothetical protein DRJ19_06070 [Candidatus Woesearchaeota archaeon]